MPDDPCKDTKYKESAIDSMRAHKDEVHLAYVTSRVIINHVCENYIWLDIHQYLLF